MEVEVEEPYTSLLDLESVQDVILSDDQIDLSSSCTIQTILPSMKVEVPLTPPQSLSAKRKFASDKAEAVMLATPLPSSSPSSDVMRRIRHEADQLLCQEELTKADALYRVEVPVLCANQLPKDDEFPSSMNSLLRERNFTVVCHPISPGIEQKLSWNPVEKFEPIDNTERWTDGADDACCELKLFESPSAVSKIERMQLTPLKEAITPAIPMETKSSLTDMADIVRQKRSLQSDLGLSPKCKARPLSVHRYLSNHLAAVNGADITNTIYELRTASCNVTITNTISRRIRNIKRCNQRLQASHARGGPSTIRVHCNEYISHATTPYSFSVASSFSKLDYS